MLPIDKKNVYITKEGNEFVIKYMVVHGAVTTKQQIRLTEEDVLHMAESIK